MDYVRRPHRSKRANQIGIQQNVKQRYSLLPDCIEVVGGGRVEGRNYLLHHLPNVCFLMGAKSQKLSVPLVHPLADRCQFHLYCMFGGLDHAT